MFDFTKEYNGEFKALEEGKYDLLIESAQFKAPKNGGNDYLEIVFCTDKNRKIFSIKNVFNANDMARNIAMAQLKELLVACGHDVSVLKDATKEKVISMIVGKTVNAYVTVRPAQNGFKESNDTAKYEATKTVIKMPEQDSIIPF